MQDELRPMHMQASVWYGDRDVVSDNQGPRCGMIRRPKQLMRGSTTIGEWAGRWRLRAGARGTKTRRALDKERRCEGEDEGERCRMGTDWGCEWPRPTTAKPDRQLIERHMAPPRCARGSPEAKGKNHTWLRPARQVTAPPASAIS